MKPHKNACLTLILFVAGLVGQGASAQEPQAAKPRESNESLHPWQWLHDLRQPRGVESGFVDSLLPPGVLDKARPDLADLRLRDAHDREVPFALRVRKPQLVQKSLTHTVINKGKIAKDDAVTMTLDLGEGRVDHNAIEVVTAGADFRRRVEVEGSDTSDKDWVVLLDQAIVMHVRTGSQVVEARRLDYAPSRFRYLRVRVFPDRNRANDKPEVTSVAVLSLIRSTGLEVTLPAQLGQREDVIVDRHASSAWTVDISGMTVPCSQLSFDVADESFARAYRLELVRPNEPNRVIAYGEWRRSAADANKPLEIRLDAEVVAQQLRLVVTDDRNTPLKLTAVRFHAAARQVIFETSNDLAWPLKVYFGNPNATPTNYDFARLLPESLTAARAEWASDGAAENPSYAPGAMAWMERWPWLIYVVLASVSVLLLGILVILVVRMSRTDVKPAPANEHQATSP